MRPRIKQKIFRTQLVGGVCVYFVHALHKRLAHFLFVRCCFFFHLIFWGSIYRSVCKQYHHCLRVSADVCFRGRSTWKFVFKWTTWNWNHHQTSNDCACATYPFLPRILYIFNFMLKFLQSPSPPIHDMQNFIISIEISPPSYDLILTLQSAFCMLFCTRFFGKFASPWIAFGETRR